MLQPPHLPVHPPLTSLRLFAPPYASEGGVHLPTPLWIPAFAGMTGDSNVIPKHTPCHSERSEESPPFRGA